MSWITQYWLEVLFGLLITFVGFMYKRRKAEYVEQQHIKEGTLAILRHLIVQTYDTWIDKGYIPIYVLESLESVYQAYHTLGGNGTMTKLVKELKKLPSHPPSKLLESESQSIAQMLNSTML